MRFKTNDIITLLRGRVKSNFRFQIAGIGMRRRTLALTSHWDSDILACTKRIDENEYADGRVKRVWERCEPDAQPSRKIISERRIERSLPGSR